MKTLLIDEAQIKRLKDGEKIIIHSKDSKEYKAEAFLKLEEEE